jgi:hypothetical protein
MLILLSAALALAEEPIPVMDSKGTIVIKTTVPQSEETVRAALADPEQAARLPPEVLGVTTLTSGKCVTLGVTVKGAWDPLKYTTQRCPTAHGYKYKLLGSESLTAYEAEWSLLAQPGGGTEVTYRVHTELDLPVPRALIRKGMLQSARDTLAALVKKVTHAR